MSDTVATAGGRPKVRRRTAGAVVITAVLVGVALLGWTGSGTTVLEVPNAGLQTGPFRTGYWTMCTPTNVVGLTLGATHLSTRDHGLGGPRLGTGSPPHGRLEIERRSYRVVGFTFVGDDGARQALYAWDGPVPVPACR